MVRIAIDAIDTVATFTLYSHRSHLKTTEVAVVYVRSENSAIKGKRHQGYLTYFAIPRKFSTIK